LQILAPLANRLGLGRLKWELEDLAFRFASPLRYREIVASLDEKRSQREAFVKGLVQELKRGLRRLGLDPEVSGRPKNIYSIHQKVAAKSVGFDRLLDLRACRVIVGNVDGCYTALDWIHQRFAPLLAEFDDYIARPKPNGYRSLHTVVLHDDGRPFEVQIRTQAMDREAEFGMASHWDYKEKSTGVRRDSRTGSDRDQISFVRKLLAWQQEIAQEPLEGLARRTIFVLTPMGKVLELPLGATPLDFAYSIHTELGHRCRGARVDEVMVPLNTALRSGQTVEIVAARHVSQRTETAHYLLAPGVATGQQRGGFAGTFRDAEQPAGAGLRSPGSPARLAGSAVGGPVVRQGERLGPSRDWLNPRLGFLKTSRARAKVRQWFHALDEDRDQAVGRARLIRLMRRESAMGISLDELARRLRFAQPRDLCVAFARDEVGVRAIEVCLRQTKGEACSEGPRFREIGPAYGTGIEKKRTRRKASGQGGEGVSKGGSKGKGEGSFERDGEEGGEGGGAAGSKGGRAGRQRKGAAQGL
jgi:(p)ppGpp synthase/HD superfamily hydrolase